MALRAAELYRTFGPAVYRRCLKLLRDKDAAQDATQEVFVKLLKDMERFEQIETALPWLYRVVRNGALAANRTAARRRRRSRRSPRPCATRTASCAWVRRGR